MINEPKISIPERKLKGYFLKRGLRPYCQFEIKGYIVDFAFPKWKLIVEYDGKIHQTQEQYDIEREKHLREYGWNVVRLKNINGSYEILFNRKSLYIFRDQRLAMRMLADRISIYIKKQKLKDDDYLLKYVKGETEIGKEEINKLEQIGVFIKQRFKYAIQS